MRITIILCVLLSGCGGAAVQSNPIQTNVTRQPETLVVFIGDSITEGWQLQNYLPNALNEGIGGQTSAQMLSRFQTDVLAHHPTTVVIGAGTNDIRRTTNPTIDNIQTMADMASQSGARVVIGLVPPCEDWVPPTLITDRTQGYAAILSFDAQLKQMAASYGYAVADYYDALILPDGWQNTALFLDGVHPNSAGYDVMWSVIKPLL